ncbi:cation transporter [Pseudomonas alkylphenolica]|uniref:Cation transporter n=1 Tax=Pseudomonas alkylphenolica TaxID=237609 RepID=A0A443ZHB9_9PSED|nr:cation diffusion facilitator family transporter [Pseudomonas alkylphenolica]RWU18272.1 cation transporter [Pseudomonas alkylphenolica]
MDSCCENKAGELAQLRARQSRILYIVLAINALMFVVEFAAGLIAGSTALLGDSLDMFGDASVYAVTLFVLHRSVRARAGAALFKGGFMLLFGLVVVADAVRKLILQEVPAADWMGVVGLIALAANGICFYLLFSHRSDDLNMRSTWLCSRNDLIANTSVIIAAVLVALTGSLWPDIAVGLAIAALFLHSAGQVLREAWHEWTRNPQPEMVAEPAECCAAPATEPGAACCAPASAAGATCAGAKPVLVNLCEPGQSPAAPTEIKSCCGSKDGNDATN